MTQAEINQQEKNEKIVKNDIYCNVSHEVEYIISKSYEDQDTPFSYEDIENNGQEAEFKIFGKWYTAENQDELENIIEKLKMENNIHYDKDEISEDTYTRNEDLISEAREEAEEQLQTPTEIFEWWKVSNFLLKELKEHGQPVIEDFNLWGRCTTGQAIILDYVITQIQQGIEERIKNY